MLRPSSVRTERGRLSFWAGGVFVPMDGCCAAVGAHTSRTAAGLVTCHATRTDGRLFVSRRRSLSIVHYVRTVRDRRATAHVGSSNYKAARRLVAVDRRQRRELCCAAPHHATSDREPSARRAAAARLRPTLRFWPNEPVHSEEEGWGCGGGEPPAARRLRVMMMVGSWIDGTCGLCTHAGCASCCEEKGGTK